MKKVWNDATLEELDITATAGGNQDTEKIDSNHYFDPATNKYWAYLGEDVLSKANKN